MFINSEIKNKMKEYNKLRKVHEKKLAEYQKITILNRCTSCLVYKSEMIIKFEERFKKCGMCEKFEKVYSAFYDVVLSFESLEKFEKEQYGRAIFDLLSQLKPKLLVRKNNEVISWGEAFPSAYSLFTSQQIKALISLIDEDGGKYRIIE